MKPNPARLLGQLRQAVAIVLASAIAVPALAAPDAVPGSSVQLSASSLTTIDFKFRVDADPGPGTYVYWAQQFWMEGANAGAGYLGIQRNAAVVPYGKMVLFSIWTATGAVAGSMPNAVAGPFSGEGTGYHIGAAFDFQEGRIYTFRLNRDSATSWSVVIIDHATGTHYALGSIQGPASWGNLSSTVTSFTEVFAGGLDCATVPYAKASFIAPVGNQGAVDYVPSSLSGGTYGDFQSCALGRQPGAVSGVNVGSTAQVVGRRVVEEIGLSQGPTAYDFTLALSNQVVFVPRGGSAATGLTVGTLKGLDQVALHVAGLPRGVKASFSPTSATTAGLTFSTTQAAQCGTSTVRVRGISGDYRHTVDLPVTVVCPVPVP